MIKIIVSFYLLFILIVFKATKKVKIKYIEIMFNCLLNTYCIYNKWKGSYTNATWS
jgi:hypothetical protein